MRAYSDDLPAFRVGRPYFITDHLKVEIVGLVFYTAFFSLPPAHQRHHDIGKQVVQNVHQDRRIEALETQGEPGGNERSEEYQD